MSNAAGGRFKEPPRLKKSRQSSFFKDIFGKKGPDPRVVNDWLPPMLDINEDIQSVKVPPTPTTMQRKRLKEKFRMGKFDELGFFHSQLDEIPDSEAKKVKEAQLKAIEKDKEFAREFLRSVKAQLQLQNAANQPSRQTKEGHGRI